MDVLRRSLGAFPGAAEFTDMGSRRHVLVSMRQDRISQFAASTDLPSKENARCELDSRGEKWKK